MNGLRAHALSLVRQITTEVEKFKKRPHVIFCVPAQLLAVLQDVCDEEMLGGQDCHHETAGAYTGAIAAAQLYDVGARYVLIGHSECRARGESESVIKGKLQRALEAGLKPILCVGESAQQREKGEALPFVASQIEGMPPPYAIAYEPLWAIGSGRTPSFEEIDAMHRHIAKMFSGAILYGGSVTGDNAAAIVALPSVGGVLVGGASLTFAGFKAVLDAACSTLAKGQDKA